MHISVNVLILAFPSVAKLSLEMILPSTSSKRRNSSVEAAVLGFPSGSACAAGAGSELPPWEG